MPDITLQDINTADLIDNLPAITQINGSDISAPNPVDLTEPTVDNKAQTHNVTLESLSEAIAIGSENEYSVTFQEVGTDEEITNETLNRTAQSLRDSVNAKMEALRNEVQTKLRQNNVAINTIWSNFITAMNGVLTAIYNEHTAQVGETQRVIGLATTALNQGFQNVRDNNVAQNNDIATKINLVAGELFARANTLREGINRAQQEIAALHNFFVENTDLQDKINTINSFLQSMHNTDVDIVEVLNRIMNELERQAIAEYTTYWVNASDGQANISFAGIGFGEFTNISDFTVQAQAMRANIKARVMSISTTGMTIQLVSDGTHYTPQPIDCSNDPIPVAIILLHKRRNFATLGVSLLNNSFIADNQAVEHNEVIGGITLSANTVSVTNGNTVDVTVSDEFGTVTVTSGDENIATAIYDADSKTITIEGTSVGSTVVTVQDGNSTANIEVTVTE